MAMNKHFRGFMICTSLSMYSKMRTNISVSVSLSLESLACVQLCMIPFMSR